MVDHKNLLYSNYISFIILVIDILIYLNLDYAGLHLSLIKITLFTVVNKISLLIYSEYVDIAKKRLKYPFHFQQSYMYYIC